jgi:hypothetical protein
MVGLKAWIDELRDRLERGELGRFGVVELRDGSHSLTLEQAVRIMLADLAYLDDPATAHHPASSLSWRRQCLLADFQYLRDRLAS